jgi:hypothetical protein
MILDNNDNETEDCKYGCDNLNPNPVMPINRSNSINITCLVPKEALKYDVNLIVAKDGACNWDSKGER